jgi:hypothetical protein
MDTHQKRWTIMNKIASNTVEEDIHIVYGIILLVLMIMGVICLVHRKKCLIFWEELKK